MRSHQIFSMVKLFLIFFRRDVLSVGILKQKIFRLLLVLVGVLLLIVVTSAMYMFFGEIGNKDRQVDIILDVYTVTISLWTVLIFIFLKVLFSKSGEFLKMTYNLPVTMKERNLSLLIFELFISIGLILLISSSILLSLTLRYDFIYTTTLICNILYLNLTFYLILQAIDKVIALILHVCKMSKFKNIISLSAFLILFVLLYNLSTDIVDTMLLNHLNGKQTESIFLFWEIQHEEYGFTLTTIFFIILFIVLSLFIILLPDHSYFDIKRFINIPNFTKGQNYWGIYFYNLIRRMENFNYIAISYIIFIYFYYWNIQHLMFPILIFSIIGVYTYTQTECIRIFQIKLGYSVWKDYFILIGSLFIYGVVITLPMLVFVLIEMEYIWINLSAYLFFFLAILLTTMIGILFPPKRENPFSVILSFLITFLTLLVLSLSLLVLNLSNTANAIVITIIYGIIIYFSLLGLRQLKEDVLNETS